MATDSIQYWNDPSVTASLRARQAGTTDFAKEVEQLLPPRSRVLELGCGAGDDAAWFAQHGHSVIALDVSEPLLDIAAQRFADIPDLEFHRADITHRFAVGGHSCDAVYSRLALDYFDHRTTMSIFSEVMWVLRSGGRFAFACRSVDDPSYGRGEEVEPDYFVLGEHRQHFFSVDYAAELLDATGFVRAEITTGEQKLYGEPSAYVRCVAVKP